MQVQVYTAMGEFSSGDGFLNFVPHIVPVVARPGSRCTLMGCGPSFDLNRCRSPARPAAAPLRACRQAAAVLPAAARLCLRAAIRSPTGGGASGSFDTYSSPAILASIIDWMLLW